MESSPLRKEMMSQEQRVAGKAWKKRGIWEIDGKMMEIHGKRMEKDGNSWENDGNGWEDDGNHKENS